MSLDYWQILTGPGPDNALQWDNPSVFGNVEVLHRFALSGRHEFSDQFVTLDPNGPFPTFDINSSLSQVPAAAAQFQLRNNEGGLNISTDTGNWSLNLVDGANVFLGPVLIATASTGVLELAHNFVTVAETRTAATGGLFVNNTLTGTGLERVLTTSDAGGGGGGQVNTVQSGTNITVDAADPVNPIVNLDAAITGVDVNGVTLTAAGAATDFLNAEGNYVSLPAPVQLVDLFSNPRVVALGFTGAQVLGTTLDIDNTTNNLFTSVLARNTAGGVQLGSTNLGVLQLNQTDSTGALLRQVLTADISQTSIFRSNVEIARGIFEGLGGLQVNNTLTGTGLERVLTESDGTIGEFKTGNTSRNSTTVRTADPDLVLTLPPGQYVIDYVIFWSQISSAPGLGFDFRAISGSVSTFQVRGDTDSSVQPTSFPISALSFRAAQGALVAIDGGASGGQRQVAGKVSVVVTATAEIAFFWAQESSSGSNTIVQAGSAMYATRLG